MKRLELVIIAVLTVLILIGCPGTGQDPEPEQPVPETFTSADTPGDKVSVTAGSTSFNMIYANASTGTVIPTGTDDLGTTATVDTKFFMGETELTNALMVEVLQWAYDNSKFSTTVGDHNGLDTTTAKHGTQQLLDLDDTNIKVSYDSGSFTVNSGYEEHPVTNVTWYGAVMFCNWLTEMRDGNTDNLVYTTIDTTWLDDETTETISNNGYRLPGSYEWELAARYRSDETNVVSTGGTGPWFTKGNSASGATTFYDDYSGAAGEPSKTANDAVAVFGSYWDGSSWQTTGVAETAVVKSKTPNSLGIYDMSGNAYEWCFTEASADRLSRGGSWFSGTNQLQVGYVDYHLPEYDYNLGFRVVRTQ